MWDMILLSILILVIAAGVYMLYSFIFGAAYFPSYDIQSLRRAVKKSLELFKDQDQIVFADLGSGFGRVCFEVVKIDHKIKCVGVEIDPIKVFWSRLMASIKRLEDRVVFIRGDIRKTDTRGFDIIYMFLWPGITREIEEKIFRERGRTRVIISLEHPLRLGRIEKLGKYYIEYIS